MGTYIVYWADMPISDVYVSEHESLEKALSCARVLQEKAQPYRNYYVKDVNGKIYERNVKY